MRGLLSTREHTRGQALLFLIVLIAIAAMLLVYGSSTEVARAVAADKKTRAALWYARLALIGRAAADANRPGSFPCPDNDDDGSADLFVGTGCPSYIGRLPWRTLGIGDLRDETGERLWYALSPGFRDHPAAPPLNSDTRGTLVVYSGSDATAISKEGVAIVFAAGVALPGQARHDAAERCSTTGKPVPRSRCPANYLDSIGTYNNGSAAGPYIAAPASHLFNDKLAVIVTADFMPLVEQRVALEVRNALLSYRASSACKCYPWADSGASGVSSPGVSRGRIPAVSALPEAWRPGVLPPYVAANEWMRVIHYSVARNALESGGRDCKTCVEATLSLDRTRGYEVVLVTPGYAASTRRPPGWSDYIDDAENRNADDRYVTPASRAADRDRIYAVTGADVGCAAHARVLRDNAPCGSPEGTPRSACRSAAAALAGCRCAVAADAILKPPCASTLAGRSCESALDQLRVCTS